MTLKFKKKLFSILNISAFLVFCCQGFTYKTSSLLIHCANEQAKGKQQTHYSGDSPTCKAKGWCCRWDTNSASWCSLATWMSPCGIAKWQCWDFFFWLSPSRHTAMSPTKSCFSRQCSTITNSVSSSSGFFISRLKNIRMQCEAIYYSMINSVCLLKSFSCLSLKQLLFLYILNDLSRNDTTT